LSNLNISNFIWNVADDVLRDIYVRGKYRDVILPMTVIRRLDAVLEPTKEAVLAMKAQLDKAGVANQHAALCQASGEAFYNTSPYRLRDLTSRARRQQLKADFEAYLDGFSPNVQEVLDKFKFRNQIETLIEADILGFLIEKFLDPSINLSPRPVLHADGSVRLPGLDNHSMGTVFEELIRRFNEDNNEEAGEHFTPRDVVELMAHLIFEPIANEIRSGTYLVYDGACGTGGMLTVAEDTLVKLASEQGKEVSVHLYGQESQPETYAISKADLILKGEGIEAENMQFGSTLSNDAFPSREFDFMLSNPPYGKSWKSDLERMGGKKDMKDARFKIEHGDNPNYSLITRSSDGQMLFLANLLSKMKQDTPLGSRIAEVHNGSALFTGDAGSGESNVRRWVIENDWLEAIIALPLNIFYNTGIATYIWVLSNRKSKARQGKVQLIDGTEWFKPLRKNLGKKNCKLTQEDVRRICDAFLNMEESEYSKVFPNAAFGYWKITVDRPLRLRARFTRQAVDALRYATGDEEMRKAIYSEFGARLYEDFHKIRKDIEAWLTGDEGEEEAVEGETKRPSIPEKRRKKLLDPTTWARDRKLLEAARDLWKVMGDEEFPDFNIFRREFDAAAKEHGIKLTAAEKKLIQLRLSWRDPEAPEVIKKTVKAKPEDIEATAAGALHGRFLGKVDGRDVVITYEPDTELRDTEQVPFLEDGGIEAFFRREVLPHAPDAWIDPGKTVIGYEISFTKHFYKPEPLRTLGEIEADIRALEQESEGLLENILVGGQS
jgi:type I restriction enzyme M protein